MRVGVLVGGAGGGSRVELAPAVVAEGFAEEDEDAAVDEGVVVGGADGGVTEEAEGHDGVGVGVHVGHIVGYDRQAALGTGPGEEKR